MADLTIHGISEEVMERLRQDAEGHGVSVEAVALHILSNWHPRQAHVEETLERMKGTLREYGKLMDGLKREAKPKPSGDHISHT